MRPVSSMLGMSGKGTPQASRRTGGIALWTGVLVTVFGALAVPRTANAGHYSTVAYSSPDGKVTVTPPVTGSPFAYSASQGSWGGTYGGGGSVDCNGQITATFTWVPDYDGEPPPDTVIVKKTAMTSWGGYGMTPPTGSCSDGLGDSVQGSLTRNYPFWSATYTSSGTHYSVEAGGLVLTFPCTPTAQASSTMYAHAAVWYSCEVTPVICNLAGVTVRDSDHSNNILIGQGCTGSLGAGSYTLSNYSWVISGDTFKSYVAHGYYTGRWAEATFLDSSDLAAAAPHWYWRSDGGNVDGWSSETVYGFADAYAGSQYIGQVRGSADVTVWAPYYFCGYNTGDVWVRNDSGPSLSAGDGTTPGIEWSGRAIPQDLFTGAAGQGLWAFVQAITPQRSYIDDDDLTHNWSANLRLWLDQSYPYAPPHTNAITDDSNQGWHDNDSTESSNDNPADGLPDYVKAYAVGDAFWTYMVYRPVDKGNGNQWVPLHRIGWNWSCSVSRPLLGWASLIAPPYWKTWVADVHATEDGRYTVHPRWSRVLVTSDCSWD